MPINSGTSTDMTTSQGEDAKTGLTFVIPADSKFTEHLYSKHQEPYMVNAYPENKKDEEKAIEIEKILNDPEFKSIFEQNPELLKKKPKDIVSKVENIIQTTANISLPKGFLFKSSSLEIIEILKITKKASLIKQTQISKKVKKDQDFIKFAKLILEK